MPLVINSFLPKDIVVKDATLVDNNFHPRYMAKNKTYKYSICNSKYPNPLTINQFYHFPYNLDLNIMDLCTKYLIGTHDFKSFCSTNGGAKTTIRTVYEAKINLKPSSNIIVFTICGDGFLYNMVRIIVGTLLEFGSKQIEPYKIKDIILSKDRSKAGRTAPAHGLTLYKVNY